MALLVLLAGAAPAGVVAADLLVLVEALGLDGLRQGRLLVVSHLFRLGHARRRRNRGLARLGVAARVAVGARAATAADGPLRPLLLLLLHLDLDVEDVAGELVP